MKVDKIPEVRGERLIKSDIPCPKCFSMRWPAVLFIREANGSFIQADCKECGYYIVNTFWHNLPEIAKEIQDVCDKLTPKEKADILDEILPVIQQSSEEITETYATEVVFREATRLMRETELINNPEYVRFKLGLENM